MRAYLRRLRRMRHRGRHSRCLWGPRSRASADNGLEASGGGTGEHEEEEDWEEEEVEEEKGEV